MLVTLGFSYKDVTIIHEVLWGATHPSFCPWAFVWSSDKHDMCFQDGLPRGLNRNKNNGKTKNI